MIHTADTSYEARREARRQAAIETAKINEVWGAKVREALELARLDDEAAGRR